MMRVETRESSVEDVEAIFALSLNREVLREQYAPAQGDTPARFAQRLVERRGADGHRFQCTSILVDDVLAGHVIQWYLAVGGGLECHCGWNLEPSYWGQGIMPRALEQTLDALFQESELQAVVASCFRTNQRCRRVMEKLGFHPEPMGWMEFFAHSLYSGRWRRLLKFRLTRERWRYRSRRPDFAQT